MTTTSKVAEYYVRNLQARPASVRLANENRIELKARGRVGDIRSVTEADLSDDIFRLNEGLVYEVLDREEAEKAMEENRESHLAPRHPAKDQLGKETRVEKSNTEAEKTVARIEQSNANPKQVSIDRTGLEPAAVNLPGTAVESAPAEPASEGSKAVEVPDGLTAEEQRDYVARQKGLEGPEAGLGEMKVTKEPVVRKAE